MEKDQNGVMLKEADSSVGTVRIADDVVAMIASIAASEVEGVYFQNRNSAKVTKGVKTDIRDGIVNIDMNAVIKYGYHIPEVSRSMQNKIKSAIENMTGLTCGNINIRFSDVIMK